MPAPPDVSALLAAQQKGMALLRGFYADPAVYGRDIERMFLRHWLCVGHASQVADVGDFFTTDYGDESVLIVRGKDKVIRAMLNLCRHRGAEVCPAKSGNTALFACPYHGWTYGLDGSLDSARHMPAEFDRGSHGLRQIHCREVEGVLFISFAAEPLDFGHVETTLRGALGAYGWAAAKVVHRESYPLDANWKLAVENYVECYHCSPSHPEYSKLHALEQPAPRIAKLNAAMEARTKALGIEVATLTHWSSAEGEEAIDCFRYALYDGVQTGSPDGSPVAPLMGKFSGYDGGVTSVHLGPASFLVAYADHGVIYRFMPRGLDKCDMELLWLVRGDAEPGRDFDMETLTWLWRITSDADKRIIEHTAKGVRSRFYEPGPLAPMEANEQRYLDWYLAEIA
ncbi:MAG: aromatic ring-hydroxylating dioxygenase subunit alpha [Alphaproteobacteria bacterium]|nr:aromatic ring-hydroxylating dioxygenase subunit alpha [Alphaproteobacteria bacterium]